MKSRLILLVPAFALAFVTTATLAQDATKELAEPAAAAEAPAPERDRAAKAEARAKAKSWWHADGISEAVKLSDEQLAQMDELRKQAQERGDAGAEKRRELETQINAAFLEGDLDAARKHTSELEKQSADGPGENALKFEVLGLLSEEQMEVLKTQYPDVLSDSWRRNTRRLVEKKERSKEGRGERGKQRGQRGQRGQGQAEGAAKAATEEGDAVAKDD